MCLEPIKEIRTFGDVYLPIAGKFDRRIANTARILVSPIAIEHERE